MVTLSRTPMSMKRRLIEETLRPFLDLITYYDDDCYHIRTKLAAGLRRALLPIFQP